MIKIISIAFGGALGSLARYYLSNSTLKNIIFLDVPIAVLLVNIFGSFVFGLFMGALENNIIVSENTKFFLTAGFLAAFTTFSTFAWESVVLFQNEMYLKLIAYFLKKMILTIQIFVKNAQKFLLKNLKTMILNLK